MIAGIENYCLLRIFIAFAGVLSFRHDSDDTRYPRSVVNFDLRPSRGSMDMTRWHSGVSTAKAALDMHLLDAVDGL